MWPVLCGITDHSDMMEEGVWLLGPQPDVLNVQRHQERCGSWGEMDEAMRIALAQTGTNRPPTAQRALDSCQIHYAKLGEHK